VAATIVAKINTRTPIALRIVFICGGEGDVRDAASLQMLSTPTTCL
jgi:hypothetical protein